MSFADLPPLPPLVHAGAADYAARVSAWSQRAQADLRAELDCAYGDDYWQKVDVYLPPTDEGRGTWPVLLFLHGGGWTNGCKEWMGFMAPPLVDAPMVFVSASYRLAPACRYPAIMEDCVDALAWVHANAGRLGGDPARIFVGGHSAGGHLASLVALRIDRAAARGLPKDVVKGCFPLSGSFDLRATDPAPGSMEHRIHTLLLADPADAWEASPLRYAGSSLTPFFIAHGEHDFPRLMQQAEAMVKALAETRCPVLHRAYPALDHFSVNEDCARPDSEWVMTVRHWMRKLR